MLWMTLVVAALAQDTDVPATPLPPVPPTQVAPPPPVRPAPPVPQLPQPVVGPPPVQITVDASGGLTLDGRPVSRAQLREQVRELAETDRVWSITVDPGTSAKTSGWVMGVLQSQGATRIAMNVAPVAAPPPPVAAPALAAESWIEPSGDVRFDLGFNHLDALVGKDDGSKLESSFGVRRMALGFDADMGPHWFARARVNFVSATGGREYGFVTDDGGVGAVTVAAYPDGTAVRVRDLHLDFAPGDVEHFRLRAGVQAPIFGSRDFFDDPADGYYVVGPEYETLALVAGQVHSRDLGISGRGRIGATTIEMAMLNGNSSRAGADNNAGKELSARATVEVVEGLRLRASAERGTWFPGGQHDAWSAVAEYRRDHVRLMGEWFQGTDDPDGDGGRPFGGAQGAAWVSHDLGGDLLDSVAGALRGGVYDPGLKTQDADAWALWNLGLQTWWDTHRDARLMTGLGYQVVVPMDMTAAIEHSLVMQIYWGF